MSVPQRNRSKADLDAEVDAIRRRLADAQRARGRAEAERDAAEAAAATARAALSDQFGVTTVAQATALLADLEAELGAQVDALRAALDEMGA